MRATGSISADTLSSIYLYLEIPRWAFQYWICSLMHTEAVDCEALSTPLLRMEAKGENSSVIIVSVSTLGF